MNNESGLSVSATATDEVPSPSRLPESAVAPVQEKKKGGRLNSALSNMSLIFILIGLVILFGAVIPHTFLTLSTLRSLLADNAITAVMALSLILPIAANTFDLSIGGGMGLAVIMVAWLMSDAHMNPVLAIIVTILMGLVIGIANAVIIVRLRVSSFIATLGTGTILIALQNWITGGQEIVSGIPTSFTNLGQNSIFTIPLPFFYMIAIAAVMWYVLEYRKTGRYLYATGSNADAARLAGVRTKRLTAITLLVSATVAAIAGVIFAARIGSASIDTGTPYLLPAFAAVFLGATQFKEGNVNVLGTVVAVYVLATGVQGLELMGSPFWVSDLFNGVALIVAVALAVRSGRQRVMV